MAVERKNRFLVTSEAAWFTLWTEGVFRGNGQLNPLITGWETPRTMEAADVYAAAADVMSGQAAGKPTVLSKEKHGQVEWFALYTDPKMIRLICQHPYERVRHLRLLDTSKGKRPKLLLQWQVQVIDR